MTVKERLIAQIFNLLEIIENRSNQSIINKIRGLLYEVRDLKED